MADARLNKKRVTMLCTEVKERKKERKKGTVISEANNLLSWLKS
jgi:hypothetical protein